MPTNNPKISSYVPQALYEKLIEFKDERGVSISQANIIVLSEFFGVDISNPDDESRLTSGVPSRLESLEIETADLRKQFEKLSVAFQNLSQKNSEKIDSTSSLLSDSPTQLELISSDAGDSIEVKLDKALICRRLSMNPASFNNYTSKYKNSFSEWSASKDPDGVPWNIAKEGRKYFYLPSLEISIHQKESLNDWFSKQKL